MTSASSIVAAGPRLGGPVSGPATPRTPAPRHLRGPDQGARYPDLASSLRKGLWWAVFAAFGPGAIVASVTIGSGETVFASRGGAIYGYAMLWCFLVGAVCKWFQVYGSARLLTLTGRTPLQSWMDLPGPRGWFVWFMALSTVAFMPFWLCSLPQMLGDFTTWAVGWSRPEDVPGFAQLSATEQARQIGGYALAGRCWATLYLVVAIVITWLQSYRFLEKLQTTLVGALVLCVVVSTIIAGPDWCEALHGLCVPRAPHYEPWVTQHYPHLIQGRSPWVEAMVYMGVVGGGTLSYLGYLGMLRQRRWGLMAAGVVSPPGQSPRIDANPQNVARGLKWLRAPQIDVTISFVSVVIVTLCFALLGAAVLHPQQRIPEGFSLLTEQSRFLLVLTGDGPVLGNIALWAYRIGVFFALFGTVQGLLEVWTHALREFAVALVPRMTATPLRTFRLWTLLYGAGGGLLLLWLKDVVYANVPIDPVTIITPASLVGSGIVCGLWCFALLWSDRVHLPRGLRMPIAMQVGMVVAGCLLTIAPAIGLVEFVRDLASGT